MTNKTVKTSTVLNAGIHVIEQEIEGLRALQESIGDSFIKTVELLYSVKGRVIVTGMGKSGHVAKKIAATLASTGTPAFFVHPAEASHGDLGMITRDDAILALSNSGETHELSDIIVYSRRFGIPMVCIVGKEASFLGKQSDIILLLPPFREACSLGLAPTTSTTLSMVLGDALAVALLEKRGFSREQFFERHPGGKLGKQLLKVSDLMKTGKAVPVVSETAMMGEAMIEMTRKTFGCTGVVDSKGNLIGIITDGDLRRHMGRDLLEKKVTDVMTVSPRVIPPDILAAEAVRYMGEFEISCFLVVENKKPVGVLHLHDCLNAGVV